jgi:hypothetical protein
VTILVLVELAVSVSSMRDIEHKASGNLNRSPDLKEGSQTSAPWPRRRDFIGLLCLVVNSIYTLFTGI